MLTQPIAEWQPRGHYVPKTHSCPTPIRTRLVATTWDPQIGSDGHCRLRIDCLSGLICPTFLSLTKSGKYRTSTRPHTTVVLYPKRSHDHSTLDRSRSTRGRGSGVQRIISLRSQIELGVSSASGPLSTVEPKNCRQPSKNKSELQGQEPGSLGGSSIA